MGGGSKAALRRTARFGDGWHALRKTPNQIKADLADLAALTEAEGRDPGALHISISLPVAFGMAPSSRPAGDQTSLKGEARDIAATLTAYGEAGVQEVVLSLGSHEKAAHAEMLQRLAEEVRPLL